MHRLKQWVEDINKIQNDVKYDFIFVDDEGFKKYNPQTFKELVDGFRKYKDEE